VRASLRNSAGDIVFGMEDGTVSIFGLVFGVAASAPNSHAVLLAGATGAAAAAVSMMAGTYLDVESENDRRAAALERQARNRREHPGAAEEQESRRLRDAGFSETEITTVSAVLRAHPQTADQLDAAFGLGIAPGPPQSPIVQAAWMFVADLIAATIPVLPFAWLSLSAARVASIAVTTVLLVLLGVGRAQVARKPVVSTTAETLAIAAGAACAGLVVGRLIA
jgi:VIT1/CCC1 family predicted Fe2+/Mn2+ transporter